MRNFYRAENRPSSRSDNGGFVLFLGIIVALALFFLVSRAFANKPEIYKTICHHTPSNAVTLKFLNSQSYTGHLGTPHSTQTYDTDGYCPRVTLTPTEGVTPTEEVTPTASPTATPSATPTVSPTVTPTGTVTNTTNTTNVTNVTNKEVEVPAGPPATGFGPN